MPPQHLIQSAAQKQDSTARAYEKHMNTLPSDTWCARRMLQSPLYDAHVLADGETIALTSHSLMWSVRICCRSQRLSKSVLCCIYQPGNRLHCFLLSPLQMRRCC